MAHFTSQFGYLKCVSLSKEFIHSALKYSSGTSAITSTSSIDALQKFSFSCGITLTERRLRTVAYKLINSETKNLKKNKHYTFA